MLSLSLGLGNSDWREEMWSEIFDRAKKKGKIISAKLGEHEFEYALINPKDGYQRARVSTTGDYYHYWSNTTFWIKDAEKEGCIGLNHGGLAFVLERELGRPDFADYVGLHEHIEATEGKGDHGEACRIELTEVFKRTTDFIDAYANWLASLTNKSKNPESGYFARAVPDFLQIVKEGRLSPTEVLREFKHQLDLGCPLK